MQTKYVLRGFARRYRLLNQVLDNSSEYKDSYINGIYLALDAIEVEINNLPTLRRWAVMWGMGRQEERK